MPPKGKSSFCMHFQCIVLEESWSHKRRLARGAAANGEEPAATELLPVADEGNMVKDQ
jgi:hypothetical protein